MSKAEVIVPQMHREMLLGKICSRTELLQCSDIRDKTSFQTLPEDFWHFSLPVGSQ